MPVALALGVFRPRKRVPGMDVAGVVEAVGAGVTLAFGGLTADAFLSRVAIKPGDMVLVNGASGAVGTAAVQLAKQLGARVPGVCSGANAELVTALGAERMIDYTTEDFLIEGKPMTSSWIASGMPPSNEPRRASIPAAPSCSSFPI